MSLIYDYNYQVFENEDAISYYLLGAFITDGCIYKNKNSYACQLTSCDQDWLLSIKDKIGSNIKLHMFNKNYYGIRICRKNIATWFINHGCFPKKTYTVVLPTIPDIFFADFLRGCIDGDGSLGTYFSKSSVKRSCQLISASLIFLQQIQNKLQKLDIRATITNRGKQNSILKNKRLIVAKVNSYSLNTYGTNCYKLLKFIYYNGCDLYLERKHILAQNIINYYDGLEVLDLRKIPRLNRNCKIIWDDDDKLLEQINNSNMCQVAKILNIHPTSIIHRLKARGIYNKVIKFRKVFLPSKEVLEEMSKIKTYTQMARELNTTIKTLRKKMKELGMD